MYTVLRFESPTENAEALALLGEELNEIRQGTFSGLDHVKGRFSCDVCDLDDWESHLGAIEESMVLFESILATAISRGLEVEFDVAVEPEDCEKKLYVSTNLDPNLLRKLADQKVGLTFSYYVPQHPKAD